MLNQTLRYLEEMGSEVATTAGRIEPLFGDIVQQWVAAVRPLQNADGRQLSADIGDRPQQLLQQLKQSQFEAFLREYRELIQMLYRQGISLDRLLLMFNTWESHSEPFLRRLNTDPATIELTAKLLESLYQQLFSFAAGTYHDTSRGQPPAAESNRGERLTTLTRRERQILSQIGHGYRTKEIAAHLGVSIKTVEAHRTNIMRKLGVTRLAHLVRYSLTLGAFKEPSAPAPTA